MREEHFNSDCATESSTRDGITRRGALTTIAILFGIVALPSGGTRATEPVPLRVKFTKGQTLRYVMTADGKMQGSVNGLYLRQTMVTGTIFTWKVLNVSPEGVATIQQVDERYRLVMKNPGVDINLDTANPVDDKEKALPEQLQSLINGLRKMAGKPIELTVNPRGEIERIDFSQEFLDSSGTTQELMQLAFKRDRPLKRFGELGLTALPDKPLAVGESEEIPKSVFSPATNQEIEYRIKYTRQQADIVTERELTRIDYALDFDAPVAQTIGSDARKYKFGGTILFDEPTGVISKIGCEWTMGLNVGKAIKGLLTEDPKIVQGKSEVSRTLITRLITADEDPFAEKADE